MQAVSEIFFAHDLKPEDFLHNPSNVKDKGYFRFLKVVLRDPSNRDCDDFRISRGKLLKALHDKIRENSDPEFLKNFLCYCTGQSYVPTLKAFPDFRIILEFSSGDEDEKCHPEHLPVAHTCEHTLKLPIQAYGGNEEIFFFKLNQAMEYSKESFQMH